MHADTHFRLMPAALLMKSWRGADALMKPSAPLQRNISVDADRACRARRQ